MEGLTKTKWSTPLYYIYVKYVNNDKRFKHDYIYVLQKKLYICTGGYHSLTRRNQKS